MTSNYLQPQKTPVNEDVIHSVRRILEIAADEGVSIAPALSRGLAEALTPRRGDTQCPAQSAAPLADDKANMANMAGASTCTEPEIRTFITNKKQVVYAINGNTKCYTGKENTAKEEAKPAKTAAEVGAWYTPDEAAALIGKIRGWLSGCREGHRLADLMESIKQEFHLYDSQLGELLGISGRLVGYVRHGRPSPFALTRFTEIFGTDGSAREN